MAMMEDASFAQGMFVTLWPKVERCHNYVELLVTAQEKLQKTIDQLITGLEEAEKAEGCSLVSYADRLRNFPARVERLQKKLERIEDRLLAMKESRNYKMPSMVECSTEKKSVVFTDPLF
ncbi:unnamed protein product [Peronospora farinosa]|uniref:Biogenesis of lysosome-related organelles complex 1 subunit 7 n=1 Tax=Peronospora farinosa TaxID=134698 RepID=A0AAV0TLM9_9STRA|nr:unnamed protein product [Peronospora farinosa]